MIGAPFFAKVKSAFGKLTQDQVNGFNVLSAAWDKDGDGDLRKFAYVLATAWHETAETMQPIAEYGKGKGRAYGSPDKVTGKTYYGRGYVQLTWKYNYERASKELGVDLVSNPDKAMQPEIAAPVAVLGMMEGWFTGKRLASYFNSTKSDPIWARSIINGKRKGETLPDRAVLISAYHIKFLSALKASA
ncbi:glycoside hydrolase family 19 protein [Labrys sp. La1]|uniref:glycoside hydrolase family 19 protein n=1 Tax=Labrys sp. La1 TaxID=3404917 RepID=UPI003EB9F66F